jgi:hypothetical protein
MNKLGTLLMITIIFAVALSMATEVSAWPWDPYVHIKVRVNGPKSYATSFKAGEIATIRISDTKGNAETIVHKISYYEAFRNSFAVDSNKQFYIDKPVKVEVTFRGTITTAIAPAGRPLLGDTVAVTVQLDP